jgi:hypothetical protein
MWIDARRADWFRSLTGFSLLALCRGMIQPQEVPRRIPRVPCNWWGSAGPNLRLCRNSKREGRNYQKPGQRTVRSPSGISSAGNTSRVGVVVRIGESASTTVVSKWLRMLRQALREGDGEGDSRLEERVGASARANRRSICTLGGAGAQSVLFGKVAERP